MTHYCETCDWGGIETLAAAECIWIKAKEPKDERRRSWLCNDCIEALDAKRCGDFYDMQTVKRTSD